MEARRRITYLQEGELDDVYVGEEENGELKKAARWMAVAKVIRKKTFSSASLKEALKFIRSLAHDPEIREMDDDLFVIQVYYLGDWKKLMF